MFPYIVVKIYYELPPQVYPKRYNPSPKYSEKYRVMMSIE